MLSFEQLSPENIGALAASVTAAMSIWIAIVATNFARRVARVEAERAITDRFLDTNFEQWSNVEVAELYRRTRHPGKSVDYLRIVAQTRLRLAILDKIWLAEKDGVIPDARNIYDFDGFVRLIVTTSGPAFEEALAAAGFNKAFVEEVARVRRQLKLENFTGGVQFDGKIAA